MHILLDECAPRRLYRELIGHDVRTVPEMGWSGKKNGELLQIMATHGFEVLVTVDQNVQFQQNLQGTGVAIVILSAVGNRLTDLLPLIPAVQSALQSIRPGEIVVVTA